MKVAGDLNLDNMIIRSVDLAAMKMNLLVGDDIEGIPNSIKGKNIHFDRKS